MLVTYRQTHYNQKLLDAVVCLLLAKHSSYLEKHKLLNKYIASTNLSVDFCSHSFIINENSGIIIVCSKQAVSFHVCFNFMSNGLVPLDAFLGNHHYQLFQGFDSNYDTWIYTWSRIEVGGKMEYLLSSTKIFIFLCSGVDISGTFSGAVMLSICYRYIYSVKYKWLHTLLTMWYLV